jgi:tetratricopeptide (TPR) repeat protein
MTRKEKELRYQRICDQIFSGQLKAAINELGHLTRFSSQANYFYELETLSENYKTLLKYAFDGYQDPQQETILNGISSALLSMADEIRQSLLEQELPGRKMEKSMLSRELGEDSSAVAAKIEEIFFNREVGRLIEAADLDGDGEIRPIGIPVKTMDLIFKQIWLTDKMQEDLSGIITRINLSGNVEPHEKCLIVSAVTLSLLNYFDIRKIELLIGFIDTREDQVYQRALTGLILSLMVHDRRIALHPSLITRLKDLSSDESIRSDVELILMQFLMARETEKITQAFEQEVLPDMKKMMPRIEDKLQLNDPGEEDDPEGENPKWKNLVDEVPGLFEKIEKYSKMQMEGGDVFMSTFQMLKRFDFFNAMSNWFVPFHRNHPDISSSFSGNDEINSRLIGSLENAFYICNSDKYSFALNFQAIPAQQRTMIVTNFEAEFAQMKEMATEEQLLDQSLASNAQFIQYIQDLYRFFKLYPVRGEFEDVFARNIQLSGLYFYKTIFEREGFTERLAAFYFDKEHFTEAIAVYEYIHARSAPRGDLYEKIAFGYQKLGRYKMALEFYKKAELFDNDRLWILKKQAWCSQKLKHWDAALEFYSEALKLQPEDLSLMGHVAQCQLHLLDYEEALRTYSSMRFFTPDNPRVLRPIAYCHFVLGKLEQSREGYAGIISEVADPSPYDLMTAGHVELCLGERKKALGFYKQCFGMKAVSAESLLAAFAEDEQHLISNGIPGEEIPLIKDYLLFQNE